MEYHLEFPATSISSVDLVHLLLTVGPVGLFDSAVVGDVLALRHPAVDVEVDLLHGVARVLVHDALRRLAERRDRPVVPPLL